MFALALLLFGAQVAVAPKPPTTTLAESADPRLNVLCALQSSNVALDEVFTELQRQTKVKIAVRTRWIGELRATIYTRKMPLRVMLARIASLYHLTWEVKEEKQGDYLYSFYESGQDKAYIQNLIDSGWQSVLKSVRDVQQRLTLSLQDLEKLREQGDPIARILLQNPEERFKLRLFTELDDASFERLRNYRPLSFMGDQLPPPLQQVLFQSLTQQEKEQEKAVERARLDKPETPPFKATNIDISQCHIRYFIQGEGAAAHLYALMGDKLSEFSLTFPRIRINVSDWYEEWFARTQKRLPSNRRAINRKLSSEVLISAKTWGEVAERLHTQTKLNLFSDSYEGPNYVDKSDTPRTRAFDTETSLSDALQAGREWRKLWWQESASGDDILYRNTTWYLFHGVNNYAALMRRLKEKKERQLPIALEDIAECLSLSGTYVAWLEDSLGLDLFRAQSCISVFRLYNSLSASEKRLMLAIGLNKERLTGKMRSDFQDIIDDTHAALTEREKERAILALEYRQGASRFVVRTIDDAGETQTHEIIALAATPSTLLKEGSK